MTRNRPVPQFPHVQPIIHSAREGHGFHIGQTNFYVGPGPKGSPYTILAFQFDDEDDPTVVARFVNATMAEAYIAALTDAVEKNNKHTAFMVAAAQAGNVIPQAQTLLDTLEMSEAVTE